MMTTANDQMAVGMGRRLRDRRLELGLSQVELARRLGVTYQQVQKYERGANRIAADRLHDLARILDVPIPYFYPETELLEMPDMPGLRGGLEEIGDGGFVFDGRDPAASTLGDEEHELVDAFRRIRDGRVRRRLVALIEAVAGPAPRSGRG